MLFIIEKKENRKCSITSREHTCYNVIKILIISEFQATFLANSYSSSQSVTALQDNSYLVISDDESNNDNDEADVDSDQSDGDESNAEEYREAGQPFIQSQVDVDMS